MVYDELGSDGLKKHPKGYPHCLRGTQTCSQCTNVYWSSTCKDKYIFVIELSFHVSRASSP